LDEDVHPETTDSGKSIRYVAEALLAEDGDGLLVFADQIGGDAAGIVGAEWRESATLHPDQLAVNFYLRHPAGRKYEIADLIVRPQDGSQ